MMLEVNAEVFGAYAFYSAILATKMLIMIPLTARQRFRKHVFANPEDTARNPKVDKVKFDDPDVERVRRAHLNDLENILPFFAIGLIYCFTNPDLASAKIMFQVFTGARVLHTIVYAIFPIPQPARALAFFAGVLTQACMIYKIFKHFA